jgi:hypothetical protein
MSTPRQVVEGPPGVAAWRLRSPLRPIVVRLAQVVCPPHVPAAVVMDELVGELESLLGALPAVLRRLVPGWLVAFDQGARLYPRAHGRRFVRLSDAEADDYFRAVLGMRRGGFATSVQRIKGLIIMCYYELPEVKQQLGYQPDAYIAEVTQRRLSTYGAQIRAGEAASAGSDPDQADPMASPGRLEDRTWRDHSGWPDAAKRGDRRYRGGVLGRDRRIGSGWGDNGCRARGRRG